MLKTVFMGATALLCLSQAAAQRRLWYTAPAKVWEEALPIGNGRLGAMVYGGDTEEDLQFNEETLWTGGPRPYARLGAHLYLDSIRALLDRGERQRAEALAMEHFMGLKSEPKDDAKTGAYQAAYQPFGSLRLIFPEGKTEEYARSLDLERAVAEIRYRRGGVLFSRSYIASHPDNAIAIRLAADRPKQISLRLALDAEHPDRQVFRVDDRTIALRVKVDGGALEATAFVTVNTTGGRVAERNGELHIEGADRAEVLLTGATNFGSYDRLASDYLARAKKHHKRVRSQPFDKLLARHERDHERLFGRFAIRLGDSAGGSLDTLPTDESLRRFRAAEDPALVALYVQYGRYLQIASSRKGTQPANLQGIWNHQLEPAWGSKYTTNINLEMNYWPTEMFSLQELHEPLFQMVRELSETGKTTAREHYRARGWVLHHNTDLWRGTAPINHANHGIWPTGGAWLVAQLWEHYRYGQDPKFVRQYYEVIKGAALFFKDVLVVDRATGHYVSTPSNSPENGGLVKGPTMDHQIIRALFRIFAAASESVGRDADLRDSIRAMIPQIAPNRIGKHGQLQEWLADVDDPANKHRHVSHLWALHPGDEINPDATPELLEAARQSLLMRGDDGTGWSLAWKINFWARLRDAAHTYKMVKMLLRPAEGRTGGSYPNLFDAHPPFQIDGNFGGAAGIGEMLLQSHLAWIDILPALPGELAAGEVSGFRARGGFELSFRWENQQLAVLRVRSNAGNVLRLRYNGKTVEMPTKKGKTYAFDGKLVRISGF